jgi:hypothetical protein
MKLVVVMLVQNLEARELKHQALEDRPETK